MRNFAFSLLFVPMIGFAQTTKPAAAKPSTTDCPTFVNKPQTSKAAFFAAMRYKPKPKTTTPAAEKEPVVTKKPVKQHTPMFSSGDKIMEKKELPEEKKIEPKKKIEEEKPKATEAAATDKKEKEIEEKKPAKKQKVNTSGKVRNTKRSASKCPDF
jgi:hypothetical protein